MLRTGILMPRSTMFPSLGLDLLNGLKENLKKQDITDHIKLLIDNIGYGVNEAEIYAKAEKMLLQEDVEMLIVFADTKIIEMLQPLFAASNKILLAVNFGANFPDDWQATPALITHSLNFCLHARLTGMLAAKETNQQAANVISYYDGGYRHCFSMLHGHQLKGGMPRFNHVTSLKAADFSLAAIIDFLEQNRDVNTLLCLYAGDEAERFYREISPLQKKLGLNLYVSPMMLDASLKESLGTAFSIDNVKGFIPWHASLKNEPNNVFKETIAALGGNPANNFSLLGWETGMILSEILRLRESGMNKIDEIIRSLTEINFESPRGWMKIDPATHYSYGPSYLAECKNNMDITVEKEAEGIDAEWMSFTNEIVPRGERSAWKNTYLCI